MKRKVGQQSKGYTVFCWWISLQTTARSTISGQYSGQARHVLVSFFLNIFNMYSVCSKVNPAEELLAEHAIWHHFTWSNPDHPSRWGWAPGCTSEDLEHLEAPAQSRVHLVEQTPALRQSRLTFILPGTRRYTFKKLSLRAASYLFVPAAAPISMNGGVIPISWPLAGDRWASLFWGEEVHLTEGLGDLQSSERVISCRSRWLLIHHPWKRHLAVWYPRGDVGERWWCLGCPDTVGPFWERLILIPSAFFPNDCRVIHVQVPQVLLRQHGVMNNIFTLIFVSGW